MAKRPGWGGYQAAPLVAAKYGAPKTRVPAPPKRLPLASGFPAAPGGVGDFEYGAYTPDYASLISGDYEYLSGLSGLNAANVADEAELGEVLSGAQRAYEGGVTELGRQLSRGTAQGHVDLAARGTLASGALGVLRGVLNEAHTKGVGQLGEQRASTERGARSSLARAQAERAMQAAALRASVANRLMQDERYQPRAGVKATWNPTLGAYMDPMGNLYDENRRQYGQYLSSADLGIPGGPSTPGMSQGVRVDAQGRMYMGGQLVGRTAAPPRRPVAPPRRR